MAYPAASCAGAGTAFWGSIGFILVLYILLVIILRAGLY